MDEDLQAYLQQGAADEAAAMADANAKAMANAWYEEDETPIIRNVVIGEGGLQGAVRAATTTPNEIGLLNGTTGRIPTYDDGGTTNVYHQGHYGWTVTDPVPTPAPNNDQVDEIALRESAISKTIQMLGDKDIDIAEFCNILDSVYNYIRWGTPIVRKNLNNQNKVNG